MLVSEYSYGYSAHKLSDLGEISGMVFEDNIVVDGQQAIGEPGIPNVVLRLTDNAGNSQSATTNNKGKYKFKHLVPGAYTVQVIVAPLSLRTGDPDGVSTPDSALVMAPKLGANFGYAGMQSTCSTISQELCRDVTDFRSCV